MPMQQGALPFTALALSIVLASLLWMPTALAEDRHEIELDLLPNGGAVGNPVCTMIPAGTVNVPGRSVHVPREEVVIPDVFIRLPPVYGPPDPRELIGDSVEEPWTEEPAQPNRVVIEFTEEGIWVYGWTVYVGGKTLEVPGQRAPGEDTVVCVDP